MKRKVIAAKLDATNENTSIRLEEILALINSLTAQATTDSIVLRLSANIKYMDTEEKRRMFLLITSHDMPYIFVGIGNATETLIKKLAETEKKERSVL